MIFVRYREGRVHLADSAVEAIVEQRQIHDSADEAGGIMLGRLIVDSCDVVVDEVVGPLSEDRRSRFTFVRPRKQAQQIVDQAWSSSHGTNIYLGEWHTHPEDVPNPSSQDLRNWKRICDSAVFEQDSLFFLIVGRLRCRMWELSKGKLPKEILPADSSNRDEPRVIS